MSLNKKKMVREIGRHTRLKNRDVQLVIETLVKVWTEELVSGGRIELENFIVIYIVERKTTQTYGVKTRFSKQVIKHLKKTKRV